MKKKISIIIPTKDRSDFLRGCLDSILKQTILDLTEVLIIDKSTSLKDKKVVEEYQKLFPSIRHIPQKNQGLYAAWNLGIRESNGKYLINLNTDDRLKNTALEILSKSLDKNNTMALVFGDCYVTNRPYENFKNNSSQGQMLNIPDYSRKALLMNCICGPHPMWRKELHKELGFFDQSYKIAGDYEFWLRISEKHKMLHIKKPLGLYYRNPQGLSSSSQMIQIKILENIRIKKKYFNSSRSKD